LLRFNFLKSLHDRSATVLVVGAGFIGVEWATEIQHFFPRVKLTVIDFLPQPLGPLPANAAKYCETRLDLSRHDIAGGVSLFVRLEGPRSKRARV
jgi:NADH dehydrogenase FAD-containing subunit